MTFVVEQMVTFRKHIIICRPYRKIHQLVKNVTASTKTVANLMVIFYIFLVLTSIFLLLLVLFHILRCIFPVFRRC